ncbi:FadR family transcriptional regulator [Rosenbergiella australiborealis]|uniref:FadR family transcriptional regulator n=3 Tax=Rosenbergiella TaxID=1356488 RepID=A0ABS5T5J8_9GAMM|nr:GntR family transcriptional regulator [Rosenbergiella australiborealis]MBT0727629.1 FadR family transcriptional regulator [Rosenbergiella australiborealis]
MMTHAIIFAPIGQASRAEQIVTRLANAIMTGLLQANEQLPNEAELAKMLGVSHITVREALNTLRAKELIYTHRGRNGGSFVCDSIESRAHHYHPLSLLSSDYLLDLGEMHCAVLAHSARLAAKRMTDDELAKLSSLVNDFQQAESSELRAQADMRCLLSLSASSQSARLATSELSLQTEWASFVALLYNDDAIHQHSFQTYRELLGTLSQQNGDAAAKSISGLIMRLTEQLVDYKLNINSSTLGSMS